MSNNRHKTILATLGVAVIMLVIGASLGSLALSSTKTLTVEQTNTVTSIQTMVSVIQQTVAEKATVTQTLLTPPPEVLCSPLFYQTDYFDNGTAPT